MTFAELLTFLCIGAASGWIAAKIVRGSSLELPGNIVVGVIGAILGGWLFDLLRITTGGGLLGSIITATAGAAVFLWIAKMVK